MRKIILNLLLIAAVSSTAVSCKDNKTGGATNAEDAAMASEMASDYDVSPSASEITWKGTKPTGSHNGTIKILSGTISVGNDILEAGEFVIDMTTISSDDLVGEDKASLEAHLMGTVQGKEGDFFDVTKYPTAKFVFTDITDNDGKKMINGNLTIKEDTKNVSFPATVSMDGNQLTITSESFNIDRTEWNVNYGSNSVFDDLGDKFISDAIELQVKIVANKI